jgi:reverse transcriptase-like protein
MSFKESFLYRSFMFKEILKKENIQAAYFDLVAKFDEESKSSKYFGIDSLSLNDFNINSAKILEKVRQEMIELKPLAPATELIIPKKRGGERKIYIYTVRDRIKAQAVFRILEPFFEEQYSSFLFSYRSSHPSYYAAKSVAKRYKKYFGQDNIFYADISDYTESIEKDILVQKLKDLGLEEGVLKLLDLFINNSIISDGKIKYWDKGVVQGTPVITFFANIYLNDLDKYVGKKVSFYRRVGDDFIVFDKDIEKVKKIREFLLKEVKELGLIISGHKTKLIKSNEDFTFLGYDFQNNKISINKSSIDKTIGFWKRKLKYYNGGDKKKISRLKKILYQDQDSIHNQFIEFISSYRQANDKKQIKGSSENFFRILTKYFFKTYSSRNQRLTKEILKDVKIPSFYQYFLDFHNGKKSITKLSLSKKKFN